VTGALDALDAGLWIVGDDLRIEYANPAAEQILGIALPQGAFLDDVVAATPHVVMATISRAIKVQESVGRAEAAYVDGDGKSRLIGYSVRVRDGALGGGSTVLCRDITAIKAIEARLNDSEAFALIAEAAGAIAHEIRNPLAIITGYLELIAAEVSGQGGAAQCMPRVFAAADRIVKVLQSFQEFAAGAPSRREVLPLVDVCRDALEVVAQEERLPEVSLVVGKPARVCVSPDAIRRALVHLLRNAREAAGEMGWVEMRVNGAAIEVLDNGPGIPEGLRHDVFRPFFTTRANHSGLGLAMSRRVIDEHGGEMRLEDRPKGGTRVGIELPPVL
jgi:signal transduction histidine kinase